MAKKAYIYMNYPNVVVLNVYLDVIKEALARLNFQCEYIKDFEGVSKQDLIVFPMGKDAFKYYFKGYRNFILWQQGTTGAESYMRHSSKIRSGILNYMDCFAMKKAKMIFYVSQYMQEYYEKLAHTSFSHRAYVMPCFNEVLDNDIFERKDYSKKVFTYVGSLDLWQCFNETVDIYAEIEKRIPNAKLNGDRIKRLPGNANFSFANSNAQKLLFSLDEQGICASAGSACSTGNVTPSHVLTAIGLPANLANGTLRVTFGKNNTMEDVNFLVEKLQTILKN